ncbi:competence type IV pilus assembly protein ComGB [Caldibacillus debilis]|uniref:Competence-related pilin export protein ComGB n=1 Tax=Caldibacillus debilis GB1 TaxID=1339248 RepID=A0A420VF31_9BACI|nr:competence type IV pilus assembly protein ComGB [Caldibacillus debilis]MBY6271779.1 hypothetical protein [Bacillaceae bacterium]OUM91745.1 MAG: hypothetical protein BAA03_04235 [Caldibacillus debilis]RKO61993.1 competence-related pilin export protein ComGB [Caldibacillus debilis GB1]
MRKKWKVEEQSRFMKRLGTLLQKGYTLGEALEFLRLQFSGKVKDAIGEAIRALEEGDSFYRVIRRFRFDPLCAVFAYYGETHGQLPESLITAGEMLERKYGQQAKFRHLLAYPVLLFAMTVGVFFILQTRILPQFVLLYENFRVKPNRLILFYLWLNGHYPQIFLAVCLLFSVLLPLFFKWGKNVSPFERQRWLAKLPGIGPFLMLWKTYYFSFHLSQLLKNGFSLHESLMVIRSDPEKKYLRETIDRIHRVLFSGKSLPDGVREIPFWLPELAAVIEHGQLAGRLDMELESFSLHCLERFYERVERLLKFVQPLMFSLIALWIVLLYVSILSPTFEMINRL